MVLTHIKNGLSFGNENHNKHFISFFVKCLAFVIPAILFGIAIDVLIDKVKQRNCFGDHIWIYISLQFLFNIYVLYVTLKVLNREYASEFQNTLPGMFFSTIFFGVQLKWFKNIQVALYPEDEREKKSL
jgi:hypothetical protein